MMKLNTTGERKRIKNHALYMWQHAMHRQTVLRQAGFIAESIDFNSRAMRHALVRQKQSFVVGSYLEVVK